MEDSDSESPGAGPSLTFAFPYLDEKIREVIRNYGSVFPKLNWSSPKAGHPDDVLHPEND